jgi:hypothetical protein
MAETAERLQGDVMRRHAPRIGNWMRTAHGHKFWPEDPRPEDIWIADIAHHLGMLCRFTGAVRMFYSVAEHSVHVCNVVRWMGYGADVQLQALLHDATEAYLNDINRPAKASPMMKGYKFMEEQVWYAVAKKFNVPVTMHDAVHKADVAAYYAERDRLIHVEEGQVDMNPKEWHMPDQWIKCWYPEVARERFLEKFREVKDGSGS